MKLGIEGRSALVCASSKGLGKACAVALAAEGVHTTLLARGAEALEGAVAEISSAGGRAEGLQCDITTAEGREMAHNRCMGSAYWRLP